MNIHRFTMACAALLLTASAPAWALNKCVGPDGRVVFQDAPCTGQGGAIIVKPASGNGGNGQEGSMAGAPASDRSALTPMVGNRLPPGSQNITPAQPSPPASPSAPPSQR